MNVPNKDIEIIKSDLNPIQVFKSLQLPEKEGNQ
jgi:hypothetical protein